MPGATHRSSNNARTHAQPTIEALHIDRGAIFSPETPSLQRRNMQLLGESWIARNDNGRSTGGAFDLGLRPETVTCPSGEARCGLALSDTRWAGRWARGFCALRHPCIIDTVHGRQIFVHHDQPIPRKLRASIATSALHQPAAPHAQRTTNREPRTAPGSHNPPQQPPCAPPWYPQRPRRLPRTVAVEKIVVLQRYEFLNTAQLSRFYAVRGSRP